nr:TSUP family transporter [Bacteriovorax sp. HI3]
MILTLIGLLTGLVLGLTGAGGALIAIPLFLTGLHVSLNEATFLSLIVVMIASGINYLGGHIGGGQKADNKIVSGLFASSFLGTAMALQIKPYVGDLVTASLLGLISLYGLWSVWKKKSSAKRGVEVKTFWPVIFSGIIFGALTTLTGLGGGVLIIPLLINFFHLSYEEALPSSLLLIFLISLSSFVMQLLKKGSGGVRGIDIFFLFIGTVLASLVVKKIMGKIPAKWSELGRRVVFTLVVLYSFMAIGQKVLV